MEVQTEVTKRPEERILRADARRNIDAVLAASAAVFLRSGVDAPIREIAGEAGVGLATLYRHFPTRADLLIAVYHHQIEACAEAAPRLLSTQASPAAALTQWIDLFVEFLATKQGLAAAYQSDDPQYAALHAFFTERLIPACTLLLDAAVETGEVTTDLTAIELMIGIGSLCAARGRHTLYQPERLVDLLILGLRTPPHSAR